MKRLVLFLIVISAFFTGFRSTGQTTSLKDDLAKTRNLVQQGNKTEASSMYADLIRKYPDSREVVLGWVMINALADLSLAISMDSRLKSNAPKDAERRAKEKS
jgi:hypothetical protein